MQLTPEGSDDGDADAIGDFLRDAATTRQWLRIYILACDFAMLYTFGREWLPVYKMR